MRKRYVSLLLCFILGFCLFALPAAAVYSVTYGDTVTIVLQPDSSKNPYVLCVGGVEVAGGETTSYGVSTYTLNLDAGEYQYDVVYKDEPTKVTGTRSVTVNPKQLDCVATEAPAAMDDLSYNGAAQDLVTAGEGGTQLGVYDQTVSTQIQYALGDATGATGTWSPDVPTGENAGDYYVWWRVSPDSVSGGTGNAKRENYAASEPTCIPVSIGKAAITLTLSIEGWTYGDEPNAPTVEGNTGRGTVTYSYKPKDADDSAYTNVAPVAAGEYTVKAAVAETENYQAGSDTADFTIRPAEIDADITVGKMTYTGKAQTPTVTVEATTVDGCNYTVTYSTDGKNYSAGLPTFTDVGTYSLYVRISAPNHEDCDIYDDEITVEAAAPAATPAPTAKPAQSPKTGDEADLALWLVLATVSVMGIALVGKRRKEE